jgi:hypothetical protein
MAFIDKKNPVVINIKLTSHGRELLAAGELDFQYYAIGDSEIDYKFNAEVNADDTEYTAFDASILQPADNNPEMISFITRNVTGDSLNLLSSVPVTAYSVENQVDSLGFFTDPNTTTPDFITDSNHVKQPDMMINMSGITGGNSVTLKKAPTFGTSGEAPVAGDLLLIKWTTSGDTTGHTINISEPRQYLWYQITGVTGSLGGDNIVVSLDRDVPNFSGMSLPSGLKAGALIYYNEINFSGDSVFNLTPTQYVDESVLSFLENSQCPTIVFPYWNLSIIHTQEIAGIQAADLKYTQFKNRKFGGFVSYIQNQAPVNKRLGVVHYTNSSPANVYAEGFLMNRLADFQLDIPTIMWHKSATPTLGATFTPNGSPKLLTGVTKSLNTTYYDLVDINNTSIVVGKVFNELKLVVIEDQELLYAMEYKSNRNFTLPNYNADTNTIVFGSGGGGTNVTWTTPENNTYDSGYGDNLANIVCLEYCHSTKDWTSFPSGSSISLGNICDAGYRVSVYNIEGEDIFTEICAKNIVTNSCIDINDNDSYGDIEVFTTALCDINNIDITEGIVFCGEVYC